MTMVAIAMLSFTFTSCDEDEYIADTLWGTWEGNIYVGHEWSGRYYDASRSSIYFDRTNRRSGTGYWVDYYSNAPWGEYIANHITWTVANGDIRIYFEEDDYEVIIYDYELSDSYFDGYIYTYDRKRVHFRLNKTSSPNWNRYHYGWDYWYDDYYAKGPKMSVLPDKTTNKFNEVYFNGRSLINQNDKTIYADKIKMMLTPKDFHAEGNTKTVIKNIKSDNLEGKK